MGAFFNQQKINNHCIVIVEIAID